MIQLTDTAITEIRRLREAKGANGPVRLGTRPGGCAGTKYRIDVVAEMQDGDTAFDQGGLRMICSAADLPALRGMVVDFSTNLVGGGFSYENPNAGSVCGCGDSFQPLVSLDPGLPTAGVGN